MCDVNVRFNPDRSRWEALRNGDEVGFLYYQVNCGVVEMSRTEVDVARLGGAAAGGVEALLIQAGVEQAREDGLRVLATSPVVDDYLNDHREECGGRR